MVTAEVRPVSKAAAKAKGFKRQVTEEVSPDVKFNTQYGFTSFGDWLEREHSRLCGHGIRCVLVKNRGGRMALFAR